MISMSASSSSLFHAPSHLKYVKRPLASV
ncbi:hypothetical protein AVEN_46591-1, partial [Araneus ventricosus]